MWKVKARLIYFAIHNGGRGGYLKFISLKSVNFRRTPRFWLTPRFWPFQSWWAGTISRYSTGESPPIQAEHREVLPHVTGEPERSQLLQILPSLTVRQFFSITAYIFPAPTLVNANVQRTYVWRTPNFSCANVLSGFLCANVLLTPKFCGRQCFCIYYWRLYFCVFCQRLYFSVVRQEFVGANILR